MHSWLRSPTTTRASTARTSASTRPVPPSLTSQPTIRAAIAFGCALLFGALLLWGNPDESPTLHQSWHAETHEVPVVAPSWTLADREGTQHASADLLGKPVLVNFWASWCPPCLDEMPSLQGLVAATAGTDLVVVAPTLDEEWEAAVTAMQRTGFGEGVLVVHDADRAVAHSFGTFKVPETYLIDREGRIAHRFVGPRDWNDPQLIEDVKAFVQQGGMKPQMNADESGR